MTNVNPTPLLFICDYVDPAHLVGGHVLVAGSALTFNNTPHDLALAHSPQEVSSPRAGYYTIPLLPAVDAEDVSAYLARYFLEKPSGSTVMVHVPSGFGVYRKSPEFESNFLVDPVPTYTTDLARIEKQLRNQFPAFAQHLEGMIQAAKAKF